MGSYTKIDKTRAQEILNLYNLGTISSLTPLSLGISNSNYKVELESQTVLLKISNDKNKEQLLGEQEILLYLNKQGYQYSLTPLSQKNGEHVYECGDYIGVVYPFVLGIPPGPSDQTCYEIGAGLAKLHTLNHDNETYSTLRSQEEVGYGPQEILHYLESPACPEDFKQQFHLFFPDRAKAFMEQHFSSGIIHGDLYYDNTLFHNNRLAYLLDFEQSGRGLHLLDLGISLSGTCIEKGRIHPQLIKSYLKGYEKVRPLPSNEKTFLHQALYLGIFSIALWRIKRFTEGTLDPHMKYSYQELLRRGAIYHEVLS